MNRITPIAFLIATLFIAPFLTGNGADAKKGGPQSAAMVPKDKMPVEEGLRLVAMNCYSCHDPSSSTEDKIAAPPLAAVKMFYQRKFDSRDSFIQAVVSFVREPTIQAALMKEAVDEYGLMPAMPMDSVDLARIAKYMFENELQKPAWFKEP